MSQNTKLVQRFQRHLQHQATLRNVDAKNQKTTKTRQIRAEASQALPAAVGNKGGVDAVVSTPLNQATSDHPAEVQQSTEYHPKTEEQCTSTELKMRLSKEKDLNQEYQTELENAYARIQDLDRKLSDANAQLNEYIINDQVEEITKQRRVIKHLQEHLQEVEIERDRLRKQFRESESTVWELQCQLRGSHRHKILAECPHDHTKNRETCNDCLSKVSQQQGKPAARKTAPKIARRRDGSLFYILT